MKLNKKQRAAPFDIDLFYDADNYAAILGDNNEWYDVYRAGGIHVDDDEEPIITPKTNEHYIWIADSLGILKKEDYL